MSLDDLYKEVILDHYKAPRNKRPMPESQLSCTRNNPLCGDEITVFARVEDAVITDVAFQGQGCSISQASASMMTQSVKGRSKAEAQQLFRQFQELVTNQASPNGNKEKLGKLTVFSGVSEFPVRVKCATLAWHTLQAALEGTQQPVSTE